MKLWLNLAILSATAVPRLFATMASKTDTKNYKFNHSM